MDTKDINVRSLLIPVNGKNLLVPNVAVAEVIPQHPLTRVNNAPNWLLGTIVWRGVTVPVISYEATRGERVPPLVPDSRIAIINTVKAGDGIPFYALSTCRIPRLRAIAEQSLQPSSDTDAQADNGVLFQGSLEGESVIVPNLDGLESLIATYWQKAA